jgi:hypothetical protein
MKLTTIPRSVLNLLGVRWRPTVGGFDEHRCERRAHPSRYIHRPERSAPLNGLRHSEVRALVADRVLTNDWRGNGDAIAINEHEQHALCDFCSEVYDAWDRLQTRIELARHADTRECV